MTTGTKEEAFELLQRNARRRTYIDEAVLTAINIATDRGEVSADDLHESCPVPAEFDGRVLGCVFKNREMWEQIRWQESRRPKCHKRPIAVWRLKKTETRREAR